MIRYYLLLRLRSLHRHLRSLGVHPFAGWLMGTLLFFGAMYALFDRIHQAERIIAALAFAAAMGNRHQRRNEWLQLAVPGKRLPLLHTAESVCVVAPFLLTLVVAGFPGYALIALAAAPLAALLPQRTFLPVPAASTRIRENWRRWSFRVLPFSRHPFEFISCLRSAWPWVIASYVVAAAAVEVDNSGLLFLSFILVAAVAVMSYQRPESDQWVWMHHGSSSSFLAEKVTTGGVHTTLLAVPLVMIGTAVWPENWYAWCIAALWMVLVVAVAVCAKYAAFPSELNIVQGLAVGIAMALPFAVLLILPWFYIQARQRLLRYFP